MTLAEIRDWLKTLNLFSGYAIAKINGAQENVLGVYSNEGAVRPVHALGGPSSYEITSIRLLVHGNKNANQTQTLALALYSALTDITGVDYDVHRIYYVDLRCTKPMPVGTDANGNYEFLINADIYSNRR